MRYHSAGNDGSNVSIYEFALPAYPDVPTTPLIVASADGRETVEPKSASFAKTGSFAPETVAAGGSYIITLCGWFQQTEKKNNFKYIFRINTLTLFQSIE